MIHKIVTLRGLVAAARSNFRDTAELRRIDITPKDF